MPPPGYGPGSNTSSATSFFCTIYERDVSMETRGDSGEKGHLFMGSHHWIADVTYRVHHDLLVFNRLMDAMELTDTQRSEYFRQPCKEKPGGFSCPEGLLPSCTKVDSFSLDDASELSSGVASCWRQLCVIATPVGVFSCNLFVFKLG